MPGSVSDPTPPPAICRCQHFKTVHFKDGQPGACGAPGCDCLEFDEVPFEESELGESILTFAREIGTVIGPDLSSRREVYSPGVPCSPGCASHLSRPCEKCGRYAAGLATGPSVGVLWLKIQELTRQHAGLAQVNKKGQLLEWNREQILGVMVMELHKENRKLIESYMNLLRDKTHNEH